MVLIQRQTGWDRQVDQWNRTEDTGGKTHANEFEALSHFLYYKIQFIYLVLC